MVMHSTDFVQENHSLKQENSSLKSACLNAQEQVQALTIQVQQLNIQLAEIDQLKHQLQWFKRQIFGRKSEKQLVKQPEQGCLFERKEPESTEPEQSTEIKAHKRRKKQRSERDARDTGLRFDSTVPTETVEILPSELAGPDADQFEVIGHDDFSKLAKRPGSYVVVIERIAKVR